eukprot:TRINITY_DN3005_c0_g1_i1.p1 TRINITY_DN3005_c0_g1~~TRINITY_DN3005_c0_g1_i1.p1  ORF type:complete len:352 (-),score=68.92 TRINITY_DN3005_c0_g1_i1:87-1142(-)
MSAKRLGVLTGGGDCPGLNAVIRAVCITAHSYGFTTVGFHDGFEGLYSLETIELENNSVRDILNIGGTILGTSNIGHFVLPLNEEVIKQAKANYDKLGLACLVCVGGDGTMSIAYELSLHGMNVVGVPKTIDNDLKSTDQTFGFDSAVHIVTEALDRLHSTACSHHRCMVVEVMGRNAGWIALHSGVAGRANVILLPEVNWNWESLFKVIDDTKKTSRYSLVVVAEGAKLPTGSQVMVADKRLGGVGTTVAEAISHNTRAETRVVVLGHIQRGGSPTSFDRLLATKYGTMAAKLACTGDYGKMASLRGTEIVAVPITADMRVQRLVDIETDQLVETARLTGVSFANEVTTA